METDKVSEAAAEVKEAKQEMEVDTKPLPFEVNNDDILLFDTEDPEAAESETDQSKTTPPKKKKGLIYYRPSKADFRHDENAVLQDRTVMLGPLELWDAQDPRILSEVEKSNMIYFKYKKNAEGELKGFVQFQCQSEEDAIAAVERLQSYKDGITVNRQTKEFQKTPEFTALLEIMSRQQQDITAGKGKVAERTICLCGIPKDVTVEEIKKLIPEAVNVSLHFKDSLDPPGFAYIEFESSEKASAMLHKTYQIEEKQVKLLALLEVPALHVVFRTLHNENLELSNAQTLSKKRRATLGEYISFLKYFLVKDPNHKDRKRIENYLTKVKDYMKACTGQGKRGGRRGGMNRGGPPMNRGRGRGVMWDMMGHGRGGMGPPMGPVRPPLMRGGPRPRGMPPMRLPRGGPRGGGRGRPNEAMSLLRGLSSMLEQIPQPAGNGFGGGLYGEEGGFGDYSGGYGGNEEFYTDGGYGPEGSFGDYTGGYGTRKRTFSGGQGGRFTQRRRPNHF